MHIVAPTRCFSCWLAVEIALEVAQLLFFDFATYKFVAFLLQHFPFFTIFYFEECLLNPASTIKVFLCFFSFIHFTAVLVLIFLTLSPLNLVFLYLLCVFF